MHLWLGSYGREWEHIASASLLAGKKMFKDDYKDPDVLPNVDKAVMAGTMTIEEYLRSCCGVVWAPLVHVMRKTILFKIYGDYLKYANPDNEMITKMLHLTLDKNKLHNEQSAQSVKICMAKYKIINRSFYEILHHICKGFNLYPYVKQH